VLIADSSRRLDTVTVALLDSVDLQRAFTPVTDGERLLFRNLFDNLVRLDCEARLRPGLAQSWAVDHERNAWELTLRPDASLPVAGRLDAGHAASIFQTSPYIDSLTARALGFDSAAAIDDRRLRVYMSEPITDSIPRFLADPSLVVMEGLASDGRRGEQSIQIGPRRSRPAIDFRSSLTRDARDALDQDIDLVVTRDLQLVDYVSSRTEFATFPLPWSRTYVLIESSDGQSLEPVLADASARRSLAGDAVRASARVAEPPFWWTNRTACRSESARQAGVSGTNLAYAQDDEVARGLAQRIVALAPTGSGLRARGLAPADFEAAIRRGTERAYVVGVPRQSLAPCRDAAFLPEGARVVPLIDTRAFAIVRKGAPPLSVEWDGTLRIVDW
jgi:hypothetical protein